VPFRRAKPIADLYDEVAPYDLVVVPDAPLASALNRRLDRPHLGSFAVQPRRLAAGGREQAEDRLAFLELVDSTDLDWKRLAYAVGNILQCWEHTGELDAVLEYDAYVDDATRAAVDHVATLETTSSRLAAYRIDDDQDVAVVGYPQLTELERSILPDSYDHYSPFVDGAFDLPPFHAFESSAAIVETVVDAVDADRADDVAVVLDAGSEYSALVESAFETAEIPFYGGPGFADDPDNRAFVQYLRVLAGSPEVRVRDVRPILTRVGVDVGVEHDEKRLRAFSAVDDVGADDAGADDAGRDVSWLLERCQTAATTSFADTLATFERRADCALDAFREELAALGVLDDAVTSRSVDRLAFYLQSYEVPVDRENDGVLLADAKSAAYVDRPLVFFLGLDESWTHSAPQRPWVDRDAQYTRNVHGFQQLLQSGVEQYYLVQDARGGSPVTPCLYFEELLETSFERFTDLDSAVHARRPSGRDVVGFEREPTDVEPETASTLSQSTLGTYVNSPRDHFFGRLVDGPDRDYFAEGNLFHDFAELAVTHPEFVDDDDVVADAVDVMLDRTRGFARDVDEPTRRTRFRAGLETIVEFFDANPLEGDVVLSSTSGWDTNAFAEYFDRPVDSPRTERWFENERLGVKGKIDLVHAPTRLLDHKSGRRKSPREVVKAAALDPPSDRPNFQALLYLAHWRTEVPDERLEFAFFHFNEVLDDVVAGDVDLDDTLSTVTYRPSTFPAYARSRSVFEDLRDDGAKNCQKTLSKAEYEDYAAVFDAADVPETTDSDELIDSAFGKAFVDRMQAVVGEYKYVRSGCEQAMRELARIRGRNFFADDVDAFETFVQARLAELNRRRAGDERFPVAGLAGDPNYRYVDHRDMLLEGER